MTYKFGFQVTLRKTGDTIFMNKKVLLYSEPSIASYIAVFYIEDYEVHRKILNQIELQHLEQVFDLAQTPLELDAEHAIKTIDEKPFKTVDGEPTGFELLLIDILYKR